MANEDKPVVLVTGAAGRDGAHLCNALTERYRVIGLDRRSASADQSAIPVDLTIDTSVAHALRQVRDRHGAHLAGVIHLAELPDTVRADDPRFVSLNVEGTRRLLDRLGRFRVDRFVLASTMLVHRPDDPIDEDAPLDPRGGYATSRAAAEQVVGGGGLPFAILRLACMYDDAAVDPALARRIAGIRERTAASHLHAGSLHTRQAMLHRDDLAAAVGRTIDRRATLPRATVMLLGEPDPPSDRQVQDRIGETLHGERWRTLAVPAAVAGVGGWVQDRLWSHLPAALGGIDEPDPHPATHAAGGDYVIDTARAAALLGWTARRRFAATLPDLLRTLKRDPRSWYAANGLPWHGHERAD